MSLIQTRLLLVVISLQLTTLSRLVMRGEPGASFILALLAVAVSVIAVLLKDRRNSGEQTQ